MEILCFDASGSTSHCDTYWKAVEKLTKVNKFDALLAWSSACKRVNHTSSKNRDYQGTEPSTFMDYILRKFNKDHISEKFGQDAQLSLHVTTDGLINEGDIRNCAEYLRKPNFPSLKKVTVHYIGHEGSMNFGLNAIFGSVADLSFTVNDIDTAKKVPSVEDLENYDDIFTPEFISYLCSRVTDLKTTDFEAFDRLRKKLIVKMENKFKETSESKPLSAKEYYDKGDARGLEKAIKDRLFASENTEYQQWKNKILSCFDKCAAIKISDTRARTKLRSNVLTKPHVVAGYKFDDQEIVVEDCITFANIDEGKICVLLKSDQPALFKCDSKYVKNPLLIFQDEAIRTTMIKRFELQPLSIDSVKKLVQGNTITSPFTRDACRAFILGPANMNEVDFNSQALASFFESEQRNKIFGNKLLWQLVVLYLIKSHIDSTVQKDESVTWPRDELHSLVNAIFKEYIQNEKLLYHLTLHVRIYLPVNRVPLYVALWYIIQVAPMFSPDSTRNLLRYPGGPLLLNLYKDANLQDKNPLDDQTNKRLQFKMKLWRIWNEMLIRRKDIELKLTTRAGYQNYCVVLDKIVLLSGRRPAELPAPDLVSGIPPSIVNKMWTTLTSKSTRFAKIDQNGNALQRPKWVILRNDKVECDEVYHMQIDPNTLRPFVICPVTNEPATKCAGKFDIKSESYARIFSLYCAKYKKYPDNSDQLVLMHNRKRAKDHVSSAYIQKYMKHVFEIYQPFVKTMSCAEFVEKYNRLGKRNDESTIEAEVEQIKIE